MAPEAVRMRDVVKQFGRTRALAGVSFSVEPGRIVGFLGRNGAGKTTTLRILAGFHPPTSGEVRVLGLDPEIDRETVAARTGYLPERPPLYDEMEVFDYLCFCGRLKGLGALEAERRLRQMSGPFGLEAVLRTHCGKLSRGFRQRVGLAQALVHGPDLVLLDEPTSGLDPEQTETTRRLIKDQAPNATVIMSSHLLAEVEHLCDRLLIIEAGRTVADDTPAALARHLSPRRRFRCVVATPCPDPANALRDLPGVAQIRDEPGGEGVRAFVVELLPDTPMEPETLSARLGAAGARLREFAEQRVPLEEVFLGFVNRTLADPAPATPTLATPPRDQAT